MDRLQLNYRAALETLLLIAVIALSGLTTYFLAPLAGQVLLNGVQTSTAGVFSGTTGSIGGGALLAGACTTGTVTVAGATTTMIAEADPNTYPGDGITWDARVTSPNTVTVRLCAILALTPTASTYNVRVIQ